MTTNSLYLNFDQAGFLIFVLLFVLRDFELRVVPAVSLSRKKFFCHSDFDEISYVDRGPQVMHEGVPYDLIQGQGQGHECLKATQEESTVSPA